jgi:hypothetical protein
MNRSNLAKGVYNIKIIHLYKLFRGCEVYYEYNRKFNRHNS